MFGRISNSGIYSMSFQIKVTHWHAVAEWTWNEGEGDDVCGICRSGQIFPKPSCRLCSDMCALLRTAYDGCAPDVKFPGDDSPVVWGACNHAMHLQASSEADAKASRHCLKRSIYDQLCPVMLEASMRRMSGTYSPPDDAPRSPHSASRNGWQVARSRSAPCAEGHGATRERVQRCVRRGRHRAPEPCMIMQPLFFAMVS